MQVKFKDGVVKMLILFPIQCSFLHGINFAAGKIDNVMSQKILLDITMVTDFRWPGKQTTEYKIVENERQWLDNVGTHAIRKLWSCCCLMPTTMYKKLTWLPEISKMW